MIPGLKRTFTDIFFTGAVVLLFFGCIASSIRSAKTVEPGMPSISMSYIRAMHTSDLSEDPGHYLPLEVRVGVAEGIDVGVQNTFDLTRDQDNLGATLWLDAKFQLTNHDNEFGDPVISTGLMKGFLYNLHETDGIWSIPLMVSFPNETVLTPTFMYRFELISDDFIPDKDAWKNPRHSLTFGMEFDLISSRPQRQVPKIGFAVSWFNSYTGGEGVDGLAVSVGFIF